MAHHTEKAVVDDRDIDGEPLLHDRRKLGCGHLEAAIAGDHPDVLLRAGGLRADGRGQREPHGAETARGDERAWRLMLEVLRLPHLVLAYICNDDGVLFASGSLGLAPDVVNDMRGVEMAIVRQIDDVAHRCGAL